MGAGDVHVGVALLEARLDGVQKRVDLSEHHLLATLVAVVVEAGARGDDDGVAGDVGDITVLLGEGGLDGGDVLHRADVAHLQTENVPKHGLVEPNLLRAGERERLVAALQIVALVAEAENGLVNRSQVIAFAAEAAELREELEAAVAEAGLLVTLDNSDNILGRHLGERHRGAELLGGLNVASEQVRRDAEGAEVGVVAHLRRDLRHQLGAAGPLVALKEMAERVDRDCAAILAEAQQRAEQQVGHVVLRELHALLQSALNNRRGLRGVERLLPQMVL